MSGRPVRVTVHGFLGMGNLGNEASLESFLAWLGRAHPEAEVRGLVADPSRLALDHGIPGDQLMSFRADPARTGRLVQIRKAWGRAWDVPRTFALVRRADVVVIPGMGVFEDSLLTHPWGLPYWQFLVAVACRLQRRALILLSVGAERAGHPVTRFFNRWTVRLAAYCSFRDRHSQEAMRSTGARARPGSVVPDLAFAFAEPVLVAPPREGHIVFGVMGYPGDDQSAAAAYEHHMVEALVRLVSRGHTVTIIVGDLADRSVAQRIRDGVRRQLPARSSDDVAVSSARSMAELMEETQQAQVVVASRFHNVVAGLLTARPTVSLGYAPKNRALLDDFGIGELSQPIQEFDVELLLTHVSQAFDRLPGFEAEAREVTARLRSEVAEQFTALATVLPDSARPRP